MAKSDQGPFEPSSVDGAENAGRSQEGDRLGVDNGFRVVAADLGMVRRPARQFPRHGFPAIERTSVHAMLHSDYTAEFLFDQPEVGNYYSLTRRQR